jgi:hypothetical protein
MSIKLKVGDIIKHNNSMDVCIIVNKIITPTKVGCRFINLGFNKSFVITPKEYIVEIRDFSEWRICNKMEGKCLRFEKWEELSL